MATKMFTTFPANLGEGKNACCASYLRSIRRIQLEERVQSCAGTIVLSDENWKGANEYIEDLKAAMANVPARQVLVNDIRQLDEVVLPDLQYRDYAARVRRARCLKQPESSCAKLKAVGNWPDVQ